MALSAKEMGEAIIRNMKEKTGRALEEWLGMIPAALAGDRRKVVAWLKEEHGLGHYQAVTVFEESIGRNEYADRAAIEERLFGPAGSPMADAYRRLEGLIRDLGNDVESTACRTYIPFKRGRQFAVLAPHQGRLRLGLALGEVPDTAIAQAGLSPVKGLGGSARITHVVELTPDSEVTDAVRQALGAAYQAN